jgi:hypothetical protein
MKGLLTKAQYLFAILNLIVISSLFSQKNDTAYLVNGDRITGEVKRFESGVLVLSTEGMSTVNIEYDKLRTLYSAKFYEILTKSGFSYYGSLRNSGMNRYIDIVISNDTVPKAIDEIVEIKPIKHRFWKRFSGSIDAGVSYYKSTRTLQYYLNSITNFRAKKYLLTLDLSMMYSKQKLSDSTYIAVKNDISLEYTHFFQGRWWLGGGLKYQENTELDLDYRLQAGVGAGYDIVHTNPIRFYTMAGLLINREKPTDSVSFSTNLEGLLSLKFTWLQFRHPKINISNTVNAMPSFTVAGRWRFEYDLSAKYEIFTDFFIGLTLYDNYDSKPSGGGPSLNDWSIIFSIGYTF